MLYNKSWIAPLLPRKDYWADKWVQWKHNMAGLLHCPTCISSLEKMVGVPYHSSVVGWSSPTASWNLRRHMEEKYAKDGVHQGMQGWICHPECIDGYWLVIFPQNDVADDIAAIAVKETDLRLTLLI